MEEFEELKRRLKNKIGNKEIPQEVRAEINKVYNRMMQIAQRNGVMNSTIEEVIIENSRVVNNIINNSVSNARKDGQLQELNYVLNRIQRNLEESKEMQLDDEERGEKNKREKQRNISSFEEMNMHSREDVGRIVRLLEESVGEVRNVTKRVLNSRGVSWDKIEQVEYELRKVMNDVQGKIPNELMKMLEDEDKQIIHEIVETYEEYEEYKKQKEQEEQGKQGEQENTNNRDKFTEELNAGIPLEEQNKFAKEFHERASSDNAKSNADYFKDDNYDQGLPDDILQ